MLFLARGKLDNLLIDALLLNGHTREHLSHFLFISVIIINMIIVLLNELNRLSSNNNTSSMKRPKCGASRTTFYPILKLQYVCVVLLFRSPITDRIGIGARSLHPYHQLSQRRLCTIPHGVFWEATQ